jgi:hypothetical protein
LYFAMGFLYCRIEPRHMELVIKSPHFFDSFNGLRYLLAGGTRGRYFNGTGLSHKKRLKTRCIPASQVHAVLGCLAIGSNYLIAHD